MCIDISTVSFSRTAEACSQKSICAVNSGSTIGPISRCGHTGGFLSTWCQKEETQVSRQFENSVQLVINCVSVHLNLRLALLRESDDCLLACDAQHAQRRHARGDPWNEF